VEKVIVREVEDVVFSFFHWPEGAFSFELMEVETEINTLKNPWRQFVLDQGLSPQYLAMEGTACRTSVTHGHGARGRAAPGRGGV